MRIDGRAIAQKVLEELKKSIKKSHLCPTLAVILVGENPASISFIKQKEKAASAIGAKIIIKKLTENTTAQKIIKIIGEANKDDGVNGIIVQLPLPSIALREGGPALDEIINHITSAKDVDGFTLNSPFTPPVALAVLKILEEIKKINLQFLVIGRGETAGKPIAETLKKLGYKVSIAHSKTTNFRGIVKKADVVISCVGKSDIIKAEMLKPSAVVIGVGIHRDASGKLAGDYNEEEISKVVSFYTPTPGGMGPINVACLMENLVKSSQNQVRPG